jgi:mono/diheme cytochrome c family protein
MEEAKPSTVAGADPARSGAPAKSSRRLPPERSTDQPTEQSIEGGPVRANVAATSPVWQNPAPPMRYPSSCSLRSTSAALLFGLGFAALAFSGACTRQATSAAPDAARGRYLVEHVAMCGDCHSPRDDKGQFAAGRALTGSPLSFQATVPMPWAPVAPPIAGLTTLSDDEAALRFLTTGAMPGGRQLLPPMPEYRFTPEDAASVLAYLRGVGPAAAR